MELNRNLYIKKTYGVGKVLKEDIIQKIGKGKRKVILDKENLNIFPNKLINNSSLLYLNEFGVNKKEFKDNILILSNKELLFHLDEVISNLRREEKIGEILKFKTNKNKAFLKTIGHYKGRRMLKRLPVNGQRTRTNHKTAKRLNK